VCGGRVVVCVCVFVRACARVCACVRVWVVVCVVVDSNGRTKIFSILSTPMSIPGTAVKALSAN